MQIYKELKEHQQSVIPCNDSESINADLSKKAAFTLAEVLITLGIIGIVAAMTLPALITNYQKKQTVNQLKKVYSEINQAIRISESEYGTIDSWDFKDFPTANDRNQYFAENYLLKNIKTVKTCSPVSTDCWTKPLNLDGGDYRVPVYLSPDDPSSSAFITASGYSVYYWLHDTGTGGWFWVDVNGPNRGPGIVGKDVFPFSFAWGATNGRYGFFSTGLDYKAVIPTREDFINGTTPSLPEFLCKKGTGANSAGGFCGALIMIDGWEIKDDYPW